MNARSSLAKPLTRHAPANPGQTPAPTLDRDALKALAWVERGMPDEKVGYAPDTPKLSDTQLKPFEPASHVRSRARTSPAQNARQK